MFARFQPCDDPSEHPPADGAELTVLRCRRPLRLVTAKGPAMEPELHPGQQVFVQDFHARGANYLERRMAWEIGGRAIVRRGVHIPGGIRLFGNRDGYEITLSRPDGWELPSDWRETGVIHPDCTCLGPLVEGYRRQKGGGRMWYVATAGWSN